MARHLIQFERTAPGVFVCSRARELKILGVVRWHQPAAAFVLEPFTALTGSEAARIGAFMAGLEASKPQRVDLATAFRACGVARRRKLAAVNE